jgi:hypothetical protein
MRAGSLNIFWTLPVLVNMPIIGGTKIMPIKTAIAERYRVYFSGFLEDRVFSVFHSLSSKLLLLSLPVFSKRNIIKCSNIFVVT